MQSKAKDFRKIGHTLSRVINIWMHLVRNILKEKQPYYPTKANVTRWFNKINCSIFDKQLIPFENIVIKRTHKMWACVTYYEEKNSPVSIRMNMKFSNKLHFVNVLAHEMVHKWQHEIIHDTGNHNKHFFSWRPIFIENGLDLNRKA